MAMEPRKTFRTLLHLPELRKIKEHEIVAPKSQGDFLGKGMFAVHKGWWQASSSSGSLGSDGFSRVPVAVKTYEDDSDDDDYGDVDDEGVRASKLRRLFDRVEQNAQRQLACGHNNVLRIFGTCRPPLRMAPMKFHLPVQRVLKPLGVQIPRLVRGLIVGVLPPSWFTTK
eukprot:699331-Amphidinium_carterae.1